MKRILSITIIAFMALILTCGPRLCTQGIAWVSMLASYVPEQGLMEGIEQTFNGENPCDLCCSIKQSSADVKGAPQEEHREIFVALKSPIAAAQLFSQHAQTPWALHLCFYQYTNHQSLLRPPIRA